MDWPTQFTITVLFHKNHISRSHMTMGVYVCALVCLFVFVSVFALCACVHRFGRLLTPTSLIKWRKLQSNLIFRENFPETIYTVQQQQHTGRQYTFGPRSDQPSIRPEIFISNQFVRWPNDGLMRTPRVKIKDEACAAEGKKRQWNIFTNQKFGNAF